MQSTAQVKPGAANFEDSPEPNFSCQVQSVQHSAEESSATPNSIAQLGHPLSNSVKAVDSFDAISFSQRSSFDVQ